MKKLTTAIACILMATALTADDGLEFHDDYYVGFSQGAYYGLMLGGIDYAVAWCMKSELEYEASRMGTGGEFQAKIEQMLVTCHEQYSSVESDKSGSE